MSKHSKAQKKSGVDLCRCVVHQASHNADRELILPQNL